ncbi:tetratricopeptide repeat protein [Nesterenkonia suensis]
MNSRDDDRPRTSPRGRPERDDRRATRRGPDLRRSNREDRARSPEIDDDVTGRELDREAASQLGTLNDNNRKLVAKHLVMAGRLIDVDPALAHEHALAASRRGGRLALVREAVGLTAYAAGDYAEAVRELRTYRRISGDQTHLPVQVDCERGLGRPQKAVELAESPEARALTGAARAELAIVVAGAHTDQGDHASALRALEVSELQKDRAFSFSPRLFTAYAEALENVGREEEAAQWRRQAFVAEKALGAGAFESPEIMDFDDEPAELPSVKDVMRPPERERPSGHLGQPTEGDT